MLAADQDIEAVVECLSKKGAKVRFKIPCSTSMTGAWECGRDHSRVDVGRSPVVSAATDSFLSNCFVVGVTSPQYVAAGAWSSSCGRSRNANRRQVSIFHEWKG